ncbi:MAG TPA: Flp pilus assembly protein CpaB [Gemmata sp.]
MKQKNSVLMVVAVGCGLVAAFLTAQMSAKPVDQMEVVVAAKDLPVGTMLTKDDLKSSVKIARRPKDGLPPTVVLNPEELVDKRLSRPIRVEEVINSQDLSKGGVITLPDGHDMVSVPLGASQAAAGFVGPGSRVDVLATLRLGNKLEAFPLLVNMLVVAVGTETAYSKNGTFPNLNSVSFAVKGKEALLLSLARSRGCTIELLLRNANKSAETDKSYNIDEVIKKLSDEKNPGGVSGVTNSIETNGKTGEPTGMPPEPPAPMTPDPVAPMVKQPDPPAPPAMPMVKVLVAKKDIAPNTEITKDLIADMFEEKALPKEFAGNAMGDLGDALGQYLKTGVSKGQWVTPGMVGLQSGKVKPPEEFIPEKPAPVAPKGPSEEPKAPVAKRKFHDVTVHTANGTTVLRYEEVAPGKWKKVAEMSVEQAAKEDAAPKAEPKAEPDKKID